MFTELAEVWCWWVFLLIFSVLSQLKELLLKNSVSKGIMGKLFLFESGSTKTTLLVASDNPNGDIREEILDGYNPNRPSVLFLGQLQKIDIQKEDDVFFYGSGLGNETNKENLRKIFRNTFEAEVQVFDDITGAGRALFGNRKGLLAIMGTGGCSAYYNGEHIQKRNGGYGYLIDDLGGGYELGKCIISAWLNGNLPSELSKELEDFFKTDRERFTYIYYLGVKENPMEALERAAGVVRLVPKYIHDEQVSDLVKDYFQRFFKTHILPLKAEFGMNTLGLVGSIANVFKDLVYEVAHENGLDLQKILRYPALNLVGYHKEKALANRDKP